VKKILLFAVISVVIVSVSITSISAQSTEIPSWVKGVANFWVEGNINDDEFGESLSFLIEQGIIKVDMPQQVNNSELEQKLIDLESENSELKNAYAKMEIKNSQLLSENSSLKNELNTPQESSSNVKSKTLPETAYKNNVTIEIISCETTASGMQNVIGFTIINTNPFPVDVDYVIQTFDSSGNLLGIIDSKFYDLDPDYLQIKETNEFNSGELSSCGVYINKVEER